MCEKISCNSLASKVSTKDFDMKRILLLGIIAGVQILTSAALAGDLKGTWHGQGSNGKTYSGPWKLVGDGNSRKMYFNGRDSACNRKPISVNVKSSGNNLTISGNGCGTSWSSRASVGNNRIQFNGNKFGKPYISNVIGW